MKARCDGTTKSNEGRKPGKYDDELANCCCLGSDTTSLFDTSAAVLVWIVALFALSDVAASATFVLLDLVESDSDSIFFFFEQAMDFFVVVVVSLQLAPI